MGKVSMRVCKAAYNVLELVVDTHKDGFSCFTSENYGLLCVLNYMRFGDGMFLGVYPGDTFVMRNNVGFDGFPNRRELDRAFFIMRHDDYMYTVDSIDPMKY